MATLLVPGRSTPIPAPSLPPSPSEEDLTRASWLDSSHDLDDPPPQAAWGALGGKNKGKAREVSETSDFLGEDVPLGPGRASTSSPAPGAMAGSAAEYPPTNDEDTETRRVEENLRRWEIAERQRRKLAREGSVKGSISSARSPASPTASSTHRPSGSAGSSVLDGVARKASLLWRGRTSSDRGTHAPLGRSSVEGSVPLREMADEGPTSPFADQPVLMSASRSHEADAELASIESTSTAKGVSASARPVLMTADSEFVGAPAAPPPVKEHPPRPFDLPEPRSPPPRTETPDPRRPPEPMEPPDPTRVPPEGRPRQGDEEEKEGGWWTDWLCGCRPARSGPPDQAARTNPFE